VFDYPDLRPVKFVGVAITVDAASKAMVARMPPHVAYHEHGFGPVLNRLDRGEFVSGPELAAMLAYNRGLPMPPAISTYLEGFLRGDVAAKRGRKGRAPDDDLVRWACEALKGHQARLRARETAQAQRPRNRREQATREQFGPKGTPYDRTIRIIHRVYFPHMETPAAVENLLSAYGRRHSSKNRANSDD
jgi:hypothetical protein